jgi:hypothetical protein
MIMRGRTKVATEKNKVFILWWNYNKYIEREGGQTHFIIDYNNKIIILFLNRIISGIVDRGNKVL